MLQHYPASTRCATILAIGLSTIGLSFCQVPSDQGIGSQSSDGSTSGLKHGRAWTKEEIRRHDDQNLLFTNGIRAYKAGKFAAARDTFLSLQGSDFEPVPQLTAIWLTRSYARLGNDAAAYDQLHRLLYPPKNASSSYSSDPLVLTYYGDLCTRLHHQKEADLAYSEVSRVGAQRFSGPMRTMLLATDSSASAKLLKSNALAVAAFSLTADKGAMKRYAEEAVAIQPNSALARFAYATLLRSRIPGGSKESIRQFWKAERLADESVQPIIDDYRRKEHVYYLSSRLESLPKGGTRESLTEFRPDGEVQTPTVPGFRTILPLD